MEKPSTGWLHDDSFLVNGDGVFFAVKYIGSIPMGTVFVFKQSCSHEEDADPKMGHDASIHVFPNSAHLLRPTFLPAVP
jgi:hypothetical protein